MSQTPCHTETVVLIVEDEPLQRLFVSDFLCDAGIDVVEAGDAPAALELLEAREDVHLLFTDIQMPGAYDGLELARRVRARWPHIHLMLTSGGRTPQGTEFPGKSRFIPKPFSPGEFFRHFHELIPPRTSSA
jgi:CheY-like chemotaxis protein